MLLDLAGAGDEVHPGRALQDLLARDLRHAAGDADDEVRVLLLAPREHAELAEDLGLGLLAHRAGVQEDDARAVSALGRRGARPRASSWPAMRSPSRTFIWQPQVSTR